ncbi:MAG: hypothetical protein GX868_18015 [Actinobacteria bacterium]|nr:hypothetical protein [Actinomycetota bacterium]
MADGLDLDAMLKRFQARAEAVKQRQVPPVEGEARRAFVEQSKLDFQDFAIIGNSEASLDDGILTFRIDLRAKA